MAGPPERYLDRYPAASPFALVPLGVPQVLVHGCDDDTVPVAMSEQYVGRAVAAGEPIDPTTPAWSTTVDHLKQLLA